MKKNKRTIICIAFAVILIGAICFCGIWKPASIELPEVVDMSTVKEPINFDEEFSNFVAGSDLGENNFVVSPISFRASMITIAEGSVGNTQKEILNAMGFSTMEEYRKWYEENTLLEEDFNKNIKEQDIDEDVFLKIKSPFWINSSFDDEFFKSEYVDNIKQNYDLEIINSNVEEIGNEINQFLSDNIGKSASTYIKENQDFRNMPFVLVNSSQIKDVWIKPFTYTSTYNGDFITQSGEKIEKEYMKTISYFNYYKNKNTELVSIPLSGDISVAFVVGDISNIYENLEKSIQQEVKLSVPRCKINTHVEGKIFEKYLSSQGVKVGLNGKGNFSNMTNEKFKIGNFMQATEISINETGLNTEPSNIIVGSGTTASKKYVDFVIDKPYYFFVYSETKDKGYNTILFGQICK